ncbi:hypothetical protein [Streptomyces sp. RPT161]|uniref:hypothetical protein n=1 Tax=Streptomyces sp. RPT161 TaxID=3015993 RepID=UPI0022B93FEB|nr:hypothetical protein [Streptomyces sp. RPT161]
MNTSSLNTTMPIAVIFGIVTLLLVRSKDVKFWEALCIGLFGFYVALTPMGWAVIGIVNWLFGGFLHH